jgi:hypothetical protein
MNIVALMYQWYDCIGVVCSVYNIYNLYFDNYHEKFVEIKINFECLCQMTRTRIRFLGCYDIQG